MPANELPNTPIFWGVSGADLILNTNPSVMRQLLGSGQVMACLASGAIAEGRRSWQDQCRGHTPFGQRIGNGVPRFRRLHPFWQRTGNNVPRFRCHSGKTAFMAGSMPRLHPFWQRLGNGVPRFRCHSGRTAFMAGSMPRLHPFWQRTGNGVPRYRCHSRINAAATPGVSEASTNCPTTSLPEKQPNFQQITHCIKSCLLENGYGRRETC
jgi:hypothetical protein